MNEREVMENGRLAILEHLCFGDSTFGLDGARDKQANPLVLREAAPGVHTDYPDDFGEMDDLGWAQDCKISLDLSQELVAPTLGNISHNTKLQRGSVQVGIEDFEAEEAFAVGLLFKHIRNVYTQNATDVNRRRAIEWVFVGKHGKSEVDFSTCCQVLGVRELVLRTRLNYELYLRWVVFPDFPYLALPMPDELKSEIIMTCGFEGANIARHAWYHPGLDEAEIFHRELMNYSEQTIRDVLAELQQKGYISRRVSNVYCTGRNPASADGVQVIERQSKQSRVIWSRLW